MSRGDWIIRKANHGRYILAENKHCYGILLSKKYYGEEIIRLIEAIIK